MIIAASISPRRGGRVVTETESAMRPSSLSRRRDKVVLPAPDGDDSTSISPRRATPETPETF